jgi:hemolysin III
MHDDQFNAPPDKPEDEWANTATHFIGILIAILGTVWMMTLVWDKPVGLMLSCLAYCTSAILVFVFSTLSHACAEPNQRTRMRAWDQGAIYLMISGTYTPFVWQFGDSFRTALMIFIWICALYGLWMKVVVKRQVNAVTVSTYLLLGWVPAVPLAAQVPLACLGGMALGGTMYSLGVVFLMFDHVRKFFHAVWHVAVILAAVCHYFVILKFIVHATA